MEILILDHFNLILFFLKILKIFSLLESIDERPERSIHRFGMIQCSC